MKQILKKIFQVIGFCILYYLALLAVSYIFFPYSGVVDTSLSAQTDRFSSKTLFIGETNHLVFGRAPLHREGKKVILLGSSNVREGFRVADIQNAVDGVSVHNLAVGGSNVTQLEEIVDLAYSAMPQGPRSPVTFVVGIWYGSFVDDATRWKGSSTDVSEAKAQFHMYRKRGIVTEPDLLAPYTDYLSVLLRPYFLLNKCFFTLSSFKWSGAKKTGLKNLDAITVSEKDKKEAMEFWYTYMGGDRGKQLQDEQFRRLMSVAGEISQNGDQLIIVDMPIASWHALRSSHFANYQSKKNDYLCKMETLSNVKYVNFQDMDNEGDYYDSAHPKPNRAKAWSVRLANVLKNNI